MDFQHIQTFAGVSPITTARAEGEFDLVAACREAMLSYGLGDKVTSVFDQDLNIRQAANLGVVGQRHILNRYFNLQLLTKASLSVDERFCLIDRGSAEDWLRIFRDTIVPFLAVHDLPTHIA